MPNRHDKGSALHLLNTLIPAPLVVAATGGGCTLENQRNWVARKLFSTKLPEAKAGHPRQFPLLAVYEAEMLARAANDGTPLLTIRYAFEQRRWLSLEKYVDDGNGGSIEKDFARLVEGDRWDEFSLRPNDDPVFWLIILGPKMGDHQVTMGCYPVTRETMFDKLLSDPDNDYTGSNFLLINITDVVRKVLFRLEQEGWEPEAEA